MSDPLPPVPEPGTPSGAPPGGGEGIAVGRAVAVLVVAVVVGIVALQGATRGSPGPTTTTTGPTATTSPPPTTTTTTVPPSTVKVLVANGTSAANVAAHYTAALQAKGWAMQPDTDTTNPVTASNVYYASGQQAEAAAVAAQLGLKPTAVQPLTTAVPVTGTTGVDVVAVIGPDLAGQGFAAT